MPLALRWPGGGRHAVEEKQIMLHLERNSDGRELGSRVVGLPWLLDALH